MREKTPPSTLDQPEDQVRLKPFLGMRPGVYLAVGLSLIIFLLLFLILLYPGVSNPGSVVVYTSVPSGAALRIDGVYTGSSPCKVFVPRGEHTIEAALRGFETVKTDVTVSGRLFASKLFPLRYELNVEFETADPAAALAVSALDYASWTFVGEPTAAWQVPLALSEGVYRIGPAAREIDADGILAAASRFAVTRAAMRDLVRAKNFADSGGIAPSPLVLMRSAQEIIAFLSDNTGSAAWLAEALPDDAKSALISSAWYEKQLTDFAAIAAGESLAPPPAENTADFPSRQIRVGGLLFTGIGGGNLAQGEPFPHQIPIEPFLIGVTEVSISAYVDFLDANPKWRPDQREALIQEGSANSEYLADIEMFIPTRNTAITKISAVSWFAAKAFCEWLTGKLPDSFSGWEIRLPTEAEWEFAAKTSQRWGSGIFAQDSVWEWCDDPFSPLPFFAAPREAVYAAGSPERSVRGGLWLNIPGSAGLETRASLPPASCSPVVSFRPVIVRRLNSE